MVNYDELSYKEKRNVWVVKQWNDGKTVMLTSGKWISINNYDGISDIFRYCYETDGPICQGEPKPLNGKRYSLALVEKYNPRKGESTIYGYLVKLRWEKRHQNRQNSGLMSLPHMG